MKNSIKRPLILFLLPVLFSACVSEDPEPDPSATECKEISQTNSAGYSFVNVFDGDYLMERQIIHNGELMAYHNFYYDDEGRINQLEYTDQKTSYAPQQITYNSKGKWKELRTIYSTGDWVSEAQYDDQDQIKQFIYKQEREGSDSVYITVNYEWSGGNHIKESRPTAKHHYEVLYEYDLDRENKLRVAAEKIAFLSNNIHHSKNMLKRSVGTLTELNSGNTSKVVKEYHYEYDEAGYPTTFTVTTTKGTNAPTVSTTAIEYVCN